MREDKLCVQQSQNLGLFIAR